MATSAREEYLTTEVMTATPQKLQLMLIDAAIRSAERGKKYLQDDDNEKACEEILHAQEIVGEMLGGLNEEVAPDLVKKVASVYLFVFRSLMEASHERDGEKLDKALRVLQTERETWRQVCLDLGSTIEPETGSLDLAEQGSGDISTPPTHSPGMGSGMGSEPGLANDLPSSGLSLEA